MTDLHTYLYATQDLDSKNILVVLPFFLSVMCQVVSAIVTSEHD